MYLRKRPTLRDVASRAGVSVSTVSRIASGRAGVTADVEEKVRYAAADLGLRLEPKAATRVLAFLLSNRNILHPFHAHILFGAQSYCRSHDWDLLFLSSYYAAEVEPKEVHIPPIVCRRRFVQGVVVAGMNHAALLAQLEKHHVPHVVYGNNMVGDWTPERHDVIFVDDTRGTYEATAHLISIGHRTISYIGDTTLPWFRRSHDGYMKAMTDAGLVPAAYTLHTEERELGYLAAKSLLTGKNRPTAIVAGTDATAEGACRAARDVGLSVPQDVSVCGSNDTESSVLHPPLTTIRCFPEEVGAKLVELVLRRIEQPKAPFLQVSIPTQLIKRESCAPPCRLLSAAAPVSDGVTF